METINKILKYEWGKYNLTQSPPWDAGLGHKFTATLICLHLCLTNGYNFKINLLRFTDKGKDYEWFLKRYLPDFQFFDEEKEIGAYQDKSSTQLSPPNSNVYFTDPNTWNMKFPVFHDLRFLATYLMQKGHRKLSLSDDLKVVFHFRLGAYSISKSASYFRPLFTLLSQIKESKQFYFVFNHIKGHPNPHINITRDPALLPGHFQFVDQLCKEFKSNCSWFIEINEENSLDVMTNSDVLVTSGSSFAYLGGYLCAHCFVIFAKPKEIVEDVAVPYYHWYQTHYDNQFWLDNQGEIFFPPFFNQRIMMNRHFGRDLF